MMCYSVCSVLQYVWDSIFRRCFCSFVRNNPVIP
uniref:Uncharacterized protein n=1 Tax=Arundo donax TaxID=35708 RepID=A0A0A9AG18_ARUDO